LYVSRIEPVLPAPHRPEALFGLKPGIKPGELIDVIPTIYTNLPREMETLHTWAEYFRSLDVPFILSTREKGKKAALWKIRRAYSQ
jgi:hypothetical protein